MADIRDQLPLILSKADVIYLLNKSEWTVRQLVKEGHLTRVGKGKRVEFRREDVLAYVANLPEVHADL